MIFIWINWNEEAMVGLKRKERAVKIELRPIQCGTTVWSAMLAWLGLYSAQAYG